MYRGHLAEVTAAKFSLSGAYVASADKSGKLRVWAWTNPAKMIKMETQLFSGPILDIDWAFDNQKITACGDNGSGLCMKTVTWDTGNSMGEMVGHTKRVTTCAFRPARPFKIMTGSEDFKTAFFTGPPFKLDHTNASHTGFVNCVKFTADGTRAASCSSDKKIQFYDGLSGEPTEAIDNAHAGTIYSIAFNADGSKLLSVSADKTAKLWDVATRTAEKTFKFTGSPAVSVSEVSDMQVSCVFVKGYTGGRFVTLSLNGNLNVLDTDAPENTAVLAGHQSGAITASHYSAASNTTYTADANGCIFARDLSAPNDPVCKAETTNKRSINNCVHSGAVSGLVVVDDALLISCGWDDKVRFGVRANGRITYDENSVLSLPSQPRSMSVHTSAAVAGLVAIVSRDKVVFVDTANKRLCGEAALTGFEGKSVTVNAAQTQCAVGGSDMKTHVFELNTSDAANVGLGAELKAVETRSAVTALAYTAAGDMLAIGDQNQQVEVYSTATWEAVVRGKWVFHTSQITSLEWSASGTYLVSGSLDESIYVWNVTDIKFKKQLKFAHRGGVNTVSFTATCNAAGDGAADVELVSTGADGCVVSWKVPKA